MEQIRPVEKLHLRQDDLYVPLAPEQLVDAGAVLFSAGHEASSTEITAFAYLHRRRLDDLVTNPAVDSDLMVKELFELLPEQIEGGLLTQLTNEVDVLCAEKKLISDADAELAVFTAKADVFKPRTVNYQRPAPKRPSVNVHQGKLFPTHTAAINVTPSSDLVSKAEKLLRVENNMYNKYFAHIMRFTREKDIQRGRKILMAAGVVEIIAELPAIFLIHLTYKNFVERRFIKTMGKEFPHLRIPDNVLPGVVSSSGLRGGGTLDYAKILCGSKEEVEQNIDSDKAPPNGQLQMGLQDTDRQKPTGDKRLTPIMGMAE